MSDTLGKLGDFVRAGQAAQAAVDKLTGADRARAAVDAATVASRIVRVRQAIDDAVAAYEDELEIRLHLRDARDQLVKLGEDLAAHFERFAR